MSRLDNLMDTSEELKTIIKLYEAARNLYNTSIDKDKKEKYYKVIMDNYHLLKRKKESIDEEISKELDREARKQYKEQEVKKEKPKEYYYVHFYNRPSYCYKKKYSNDKCDPYKYIVDIYGKNATFVKDVFYAVKEPDFPIMCELINGKLYDVITQDEYILFDRNKIGKSITFTVDDVYYYINENLFNDKPVFILANKIPNSVVADNLRKLGDYNINKYKEGIDNLKREVRKGYNYLKEEKERFDYLHRDDDELIRRFKRK